MRIDRRRVGFGLFLVTAGAAAVRIDLTAEANAASLSLDSAPACGG